MKDDPEVIREALRRHLEQVSPTTGSEATICALDMTSSDVAASAHLGSSVSAPVASGDAAATPVWRPVAVVPYAAGDLRLRRGDYAMAFMAEMPRM